MIIKADRFQQSKRDEKQSQVQCGKYHHCFYSATCNALTSHHSRVSLMSSDNIDVVAIPVFVVRIFVFFLVRSWWISWFWNDILQYWKSDKCHYIDSSHAICLGSSSPCYMLRRLHCIMLSFIFSFNCQITFQLFILSFTIWCCEYIILQCFYNILLPIC